MYLYYFLAEEKENFIFVKYDELLLLETEFMVRQTRLSTSFKRHAYALNAYARCY